MEATPDQMTSMYWRIMQSAAQGKFGGGVLAQKSDLHKALKALTTPIAQKKTNIIAN